MRVDVLCHYLQYHIAIRQHTHGLAKGVVIGEHGEKTDMPLTHQRCCLMDISAAVDRNDAPLAALIDFHVRFLRQGEPMPVQ
jgi:hypothetical protein